MTGWNTIRWSRWVGACLLTACVIDDKGVGVEDTEATSETGTESSGVSASTTSGATTETGTGFLETGEATSSDTRAETETSGTETTAVETTATTESGTGFIDVRCGDTECTEGDVCVETRFPPMCVELPDGEECEPEQQKSQCGGIGFACCCDPPPPSESRCVTPEECNGLIVSCECLGDVCPEGFECIANGEDPAQQFICEPLAVP